MKTPSILIQLFALFIMHTGLSSCASQPEEDPKPMTIMLILDGLTPGAIDRIPLDKLKALKEESCYYESLHLPLPAHPEKSSTYPWSCSLPNPVLMSGTVFIGQDSLKEHLIQHSFKDQKTAFVVNDGAYKDVAGGFDTYINLRESFEDIFKDEMVFDKARELIKNEKPGFLRVHLQGPGSAGHRSHEAENANEPWYQDIWHPESPYIQQLKQADRLAADFISWMKQEGYMENTVLMILGDHGQAPGGGHPPYQPESSKTALLMAGKGVKSGVRYEYAEIIDLAPTIAYIHNIAPPKYAAGRVLKEAFINGQDSIPESRNMQKLNRLLLEAKQKEESGVPLPPEFKDILEISTWHVDISPTDIETFISRQQALID